MILNDLYVEIWEITNKICNQCKGDIIKDISVKRLLIYKGNKYKWRDGKEMHFSYNDIKFSCSYIDYYNDTNDYSKKKLLTNTVYSVYNIKGIKKEELIPFLKSKLRVIKIEKMLS